MIILHHDVEPSSCDQRGSSQFPTHPLARIFLALVMLMFIPFSAVIFYQWVFVDPRPETILVRVIRLIGAEMLLMAILGNAVILVWMVAKPAWLRALAHWCIRKIATLSLIFIPLAIVFLVWQTVVVIWEVF